jgi:hypothetical protein
MDLSQKPNKSKKPKMASYQKFFQGYTDVKVAKKHGKGFKVVRIYTDPYCIHDMDDKNWKKQKVVFGILMFFSTVIYVTAALMKLDGNGSAIVMVPGCFAAVAMLFSIVWAGIYIGCPRKMTVYDCESSSKNLKIWSVVTAVLLGCVSIANCIHLIVGEKSHIFGELLCTFGYLVSGFLVLSISLIERKTEYAEVENDTVLPFDRESEF